MEEFRSPRWWCCRRISNSWERWGEGVGKIHNTHTHIAQLLLRINWGWLNASEQQTRERDQIERAGTPPEISRNSRHSLGLEVLVSAIVYITLHLHRAGRTFIWVLWPIYKIAAAHSQSYCPEPILSPKDTNRINSASLHAPGLSSWSYSSPTSQCPRYDKHPPGSN